MHLLPSLNGHFSEKRIFSTTLLRKDTEVSDLNNCMLSWDSALWGRVWYTAPGVVATPNIKTKGTWDEYELQNPQNVFSVTNNSSKKKY